MPGPMRMTVRGVDPVVRRITDPDVIGDPTREYYKNGTKEVRKHWRGLAPVGNTGEYRKSIRRAGVSRKKIPKVAKVYSRYHVARFLEFGTRFITARQIALEALTRSMPRIKQLTREFERNVLKRLNGRRV